MIKQERESVLELPRQRRRIMFEVGDEIMGLFGDGCWYDGVIESAVIDDPDRFIIRWDDGDESEKIKCTAQLRLRGAVIAVPVTPRTPRLGKVETTSTEAPLAGNLAADTGHSPEIPSDNADTAGHGFEGEGVCTANRDEGNEMAQNNADVTENDNENQSVSAAQDGNGTEGTLTREEDETDALDSQTKLKGKRAKRKAKKNKKNGLVENPKASELVGGEKSGMTDGLEISDLSADASIKTDFLSVQPTSPNSSTEARCGPHADADDAQCHAPADTSDQADAPGSNKTETDSTTPTLSHNDQDTSAHHQSALVSNEEACAPDNGAEVSWRISPPCPLDDSVPHHWAGQTTRDQEHDRVDNEKEQGIGDQDDTDPHQPAREVEAGGAGLEEVSGDEEAEEDEDAMPALASHPATQAPDDDEEKPTTDSVITPTVVPAEPEEPHKPAVRKVRLVVPAQNNKDELSVAVTVGSLSCLASTPPEPVADHRPTPPRASTSKKPANVPALDMGKVQQGEPVQHVNLKKAQDAQSEADAVDKPRPARKELARASRGPSRSAYRHVSRASSESCCTSERSGGFDTVLASPVFFSTQGLRGKALSASRASHSMSPDHSDLDTSSNSCPARPLVVSAQRAAEIVERLSSSALSEKKENLRLLYEEEEMRTRAATAKFRITARSRQLSARGESERADVVLRLTQHGVLHQEKVQRMREEQASKEVQQCRPLSIDHNSKLLASKWAAHGDVVTRLSKLGVKKRREAIQTVREQMLLQEQAQTAQWTMEEGSKSAQLAGARKAQGDVVTRLWKLDTEAKRERIRELEQSYLRELEEGKEQASKHSTAGAACKTLKAHKSPRVSTNVSNTESNHDIIKRLAYMDLEMRKSKLQQLELEHKLQNNDVVPRGAPASREKKDESKSKDKSKELSRQLANKRLSQGNVITRLAKVDVERKKEQQQRALEEAQRKAEADASDRRESASTLRTQTSRQVTEQLAAKRTAHGDVFVRLAEVDVEKQQKQRAKRSALAVPLHTNPANAQRNFAAALRGGPAADGGGCSAGKASASSSSSKPSNSKSPSRSSPSGFSPASSTVRVGTVSPAAEAENALVKRLFVDSTDKMLQRRRELAERAEQELKEATETKVFMSAKSRELMQSSGLRRGATLEERSRLMLERKQEAIEQKRLKEEEDVQRLQEQGRLLRLHATTAPHKDPADKTRHSPPRPLSAGATRAPQKTPPHTSLSREVKALTADERAELNATIASLRRQLNASQKQHQRQQQQDGDEKTDKQDDAGKTIEVAVYEQKAARLAEVEEELVSCNHRIALRETELEGARSRNRVLSNEMACLRKQLDEANKAGELARAELTASLAALEICQADLASALNSKCPPPTPGSVA